MADAIEIFTNSSSERIEVITSGAQGPQGPQGEPGTPGATFDQDLNTTDNVSFAELSTGTMYTGTIRSPGDDSAISLSDEGIGFSSQFYSFIAPQNFRAALGLGTASTADSDDFATAAQGALAASAVQPNTNPVFWAVDISSDDTPILTIEDTSLLQSVQITHDTVRWNSAYETKLKANSSTAASVDVTLPSSSGTLALTSDIPTTFAASAITSGTLDTARLGSGSASSGTWLRGDSTWQALPAAGTKTYYRATPRDNQPPASGFATLDTRNSIAVLDFDDASTESAVFVGVMPEGAVVSSGLIVILKWMATTATSGDVRWSVDFERCTTDLDSDSFDTATAATATTNGTSGIVTSTSITCTTIDSIVAGDLFRVRVQRVGGNAADTMSGDAELVAVEIRSAA